MELSLRLSSICYLGAIIQHSDQINWCRIVTMILHARSKEAYLYHANYSYHYYS